MMGRTLYCEQCSEYGRTSEGFRHSILGEQYGRVVLCLPCARAWRLHGMGARPYGPAARAAYAAHDAIVAQDMSLDTREGDE